MSLDMILFLCGLCILLALCGVLLVMLDRKRSARKRRLHVAANGTSRSHMPKQEETPPTEKPAQAHPALMGRVLGHLETARLNAGFKFSLQELLVQLAVAVMGIYAACAVLPGTPVILALLLSLVLPGLAMTLVFRLKRARHIASFSAGLPEALDVFARGLKAGRPVADSLSIVVENASGPIKTEFERCRDELHVGASLIGSLERLCTRMPTQEVVFFSVATSLQSETGGNLIETMENLADQLRERRKLKKKARALSSEARASALILASLPFAVTGTLALLNPAYLLPLIEDSRGQVMLAAGLFSITLGVATMARMGKLDV